MSRCRLCPGMLCVPEYRCHGFPSPAKRGNSIEATGPGARPDQFYANERSLGEDPLRGGGSRVTWQFRGRSDHSTRSHGSVLFLSLAAEGKVQRYRVKASRESWSLEVSAWELRAKCVQRLRYPPNKFKDREKKRSFTSFGCVPLGELGKQRRQGKRRRTRPEGNRGRKAPSYFFLGRRLLASAPGRLEDEKDSNLQPCKCLTLT